MGKNRHLLFSLALLFISINLSICAIPIIYAIPSENISKQIEDILKKQMIEWNKGNIEGFMEYYWKSEQLTFQADNLKLKGWDTLLNRYRQNYPPEKMGFLEFSNLEICSLSEGHAYITGRWKVTAKEKVSSGLFTIIFKRFPEGWRIILDHTSS